MVRIHEVLVSTTVVLFYHTLHTVYFVLHRIVDIINNNNYSK